MLWLSEISHHFHGDSYCYGGGYYRRGHAQHALVFTPENQKITETNLKTVDDSSIDYTLLLAGEFPVSSAVVLCFRAQILSPVAMWCWCPVFTVANRKSLVVMTVSATLWRRTAPFVVLVIDKLPGVGAMKDDAGASAGCRGEYLWSHPSELPHLQLPTLEELANQRIGLCARRYAAVRLRNLGRGRAAT